MAKKQPSAVSAELLDELLAGQDPATVLTSDGLLGDLKKALAERMLNAAYSGPCRSPIPAHGDHSFRLMPITESSACRSPIPAHADHFGIGAGMGF